MFKAIRHVLFMFVAAFWCFSTPEANAQADTYSSENLIPNILYWRTDENFINPAKVLARKDNFKDRSGVKFQAGDNVWLWWKKPEGFVFPKGQGLLSGRYFNASNIDLYWQKGDGPWQHKFYDSRNGHDEIVIGEIGVLAFPETLDDVQHILLRLERPLTMAGLSEIRFISAQDLNADQNLLRLFFGLLFGIVVAMFIYNFVLFFALRMPLQVFYLIYSIGVLFYTWSVSSVYGPLKPFLTGLTPLYFPHLAIGITGWGMFMFVSHAVDRKFFPHTITKFFQIAAYAVLAASVLAVYLGPTSFSYILLGRDIIGAFTILLFFTVGLHAFIKGCRNHLLLTGALIVPGAALILTFVWRNTGLSMPFWVDHSIVMSFAIENILLAAVIAERIRNIRLERDEARRNQEELAQKANTDFLTNVYNRRFIVDYGKALFGSANGREDVAIVMLDLDRFKYVNDTFGHDVGDEILTMTASVCSQNLRPDDLIGRFGGEEFLIILPRTDPATAHAVAERLRRSLHSITLPGLSALGVKHISASFGVASGKTGVSNMNELIKRADEAMLQAKERGRDQVVIWDPFY